MDFANLDLADNQEVARLIIKEASKIEFKSRKEFEKFRNKIIKEKKARIFHNLYFIKAYEDLLKENQIPENQSLLNLIQKRSVRTLSGVAPVTVMTKPFPCPGRCIYCPTDVRMPKSYLPSQPAAQRAFRQEFNPYTQVFVRLKALHITGHQVSKVELRVIGGTWSSYPKKYQKWFLKQCLIAMNEFHQHISQGKTDRMQDITQSKDIKSIYGTDRINTVTLKPLGNQKISWEEVVKINETAQVRCIGINIETRPDHITKKEVRRLRHLGVTKTEIGVQTTDDRVQEITKRGHDLQSVIDATKLLKDAGFKIGYHMMPNLPGSTLEIDKKMIHDIFKDDKYQPDYLKIYPCVVVPQSELALIHRKGGFNTYDDKTLEDILYQQMKDVPEWCRVDRIARDIPSDDIEDGFKTSNIRQVIEARLEKDKTPPRDIRYREIKNTIVEPENIRFIIRTYQASGGVEHFLSYEDIVNDKLIALLRLRFPQKTFIPELKNTAIIREVHVYGKQISIGSIFPNEKQHVGWGSKLMADAENLSKENQYKKVSVIAGIGTREYYKKKGYVLEGTYMTKDLG
ncbi:tRNA uridine(34) 5-carboxymethylaminomethyl modification radical SAM/GNAT enzyme Elp3 [Candidatus Peregrinibacteria bacterium HGW-Peregrinibacteria-1]|jgi:elongator complex protein 3|nr:MAG: tRNA uridine(34) 5-carboxymethylaminomethyl modification radical SAM/GNAT enzyme Elp3 [Candidatus Peregrinibacteria bacterium HGW-Peregrinibacteria-1]